MSRVHPVLLLPPIESMALAYYTPTVTPTPVATRLPSPEKTADTVNGFLRVESGGGFLGDDDLMWDISVILHAYSPDEVEAESICGRATSYGAAAQGEHVVVGSDQWYVTSARAALLPTREEDPELPMLSRYRAMVTWRVPGKQAV